MKMRPLLVAAYLCASVSVFWITLPSSARAESYRSSQFTLKDPLIGGGLIGDSTATNAQEGVPQVAGLSDIQKKSRVLLVVLMLAVCLLIGAISLLIRARKARRL